MKTPSYYTQPLIDLFWSRVKIGLEDECWLWQAGKFSDGYGAFWIPKLKKLFKSHRVSWELSNHRIPKGLLVCHECDVNGCNNPKHLFLGTPLQNMQDRDKKGRKNTPVGEQHGMTKLTDQQALEMVARKHKGERVIDLAIEYGISEGHVCHLVSGKYRKYLWRKDGQNINQ